jgi:hypothetical protein
MKRSTQKQMNAAMDVVKEAMNLKSRWAACNYIYGNSGPAQAFEKLGFSLSHYANGVWTVSNYEKYGFKWFTIAPCDLWMPKLTIDSIEARQ